MNLDLLVSVHSITSLEDEKRGGFCLIIGWRVNVWNRCFIILYYVVFI